MLCHECQISVKAPEAFNLFSISLMLHCSTLALIFPFFLFLYIFFHNSYNTTCCIFAGSADHNGYQVLQATCQDFIDKIRDVHKKFILAILFLSGKCLALHLLNVLRESGFHLISSADISAKVRRLRNETKTKTKANPRMFFLVSFLCFPCSFLDF